MNIHFKILLMMVASLTLCGCGAISHHLASIDSCFERIVETRNYYEAIYLGKSSEVLKEDLNLKKEPRKNASHAGVRYEEEWTYKIPLGWMEADCGRTVWFYVNEGIIGAVNVW
jgi:hypothetical protein